MNSHEIQIKGSTSILSVVMQRYNKSLLFYERWVDYTYLVKKKWEAYYAKTAKKETLFLWLLYQLKLQRLF